MIRGAYTSDARSSGHSLDYYSLDMVRDVVYVFFFCISFALLAIFF